MKYLTQKEAADKIGIKVDTLRRLRRGGTFTDVKCRATNRGHRFLEKEVEEVIIGKRKPKYP